MSADRSKPTSDDARSLAEKLLDFDQSLTPGERTLFRRKIQDAVDAGIDVEGHRMEGLWGSDDNGIYFTWVEVDDDATTRSDRSRWSSMPGSESDVKGSNTVRTLEGTA